MWLNWNVATVNATFQFLDIYRLLLSYVNLLLFNLNFNSISCLNYVLH